jgi:hypothetical protein
MPTPEEQELYVSIWAKAIDTQMHFNEMAVKSRQFGLAFVAAALGVGIVLIGHGEDYAIPLFCGLKLNASVVIAIAGAVALYSVMQLDLYVYHKMLRGAVRFGEDFEQKYMKTIFDLEKGMTQAITHFSQYQDADTVTNADGRLLYRGVNRKSALEKIRRFYRFLIASLLILAVVLFVARNFGHA